MAAQTRPAKKVLFMNIEEKAKAYDEALEKVRPLYKQAKGDNCPIWSTYEYLFPELTESEDEIIRKTLLRCCDGWEKGQFGCMKKEDVPLIRAYLEKRKEEKSTLVEKLRSISTPADENWFEIQKQWEKEDEQKPAEWSEEEQTIIDGACNALEIHGHSKLADKLKSLRPQPAWKPSEQEKGALRTAICVLTEERNFPKTAGHLQAILDAFEGKESRKG